MIKTQLLKFFAGLPPQKLLNLVLILGIMALFGWLKILIGNDTSDRKAAYQAAEKKCETETALLKGRISVLEYKYDSLINKAVRDKQETINLLQQMLNRSQKIKSQLKSRQ